MSTAAASALQSSREPELYEALIRVSQAIGAHRDPGQLFRALAKELHSVIDFDSIAVVQYGDTGKALYWHLAEKCKQVAEAQRSKVSEQDSVIRWVYDHQQLVVISRVEQEARFPRMMNVFGECGIRSACALPLTTVHRRLGVLFLGSQASETYSEPDLAFLSLLANQIALASDDALNFKALQLAQ